MSADGAVPPVAEIVAALTDALPRRGVRVTDSLSYRHGRGRLPAVRLEVSDARGREHTVRVAEGGVEGPVTASLWVRGPALSMTFWTRPIEEAAATYADDLVECSERVGRSTSELSNDDVRRLVAFSEATRGVPFPPPAAPGQSLDAFDEFVELARTADTDRAFEYDPVRALVDDVLSGAPLEWAIRRARAAA